MTTPKRRYIDELLDGIHFSSGGPVSISLETAERLKDLYQIATRNLPFVANHIALFQSSQCLKHLDEEMPEPKP